VSETVLIVDDSLTVRMDLAEAFETAGFRTLTCSTLAEARGILAREPVNVAVLDVLLPDGDGVDLLGEIRASHATARIAILMLSTETEVKDRIRGLQTGADEYVGKPYDANYVVARALQFLRAGSAAPAADRPCILIIDDSPTFREEMRQALEDAGYAVLAATSGEEGLRVAADRRPNAIVVDGMLPGIDGANVIRRVRLDAAMQGIPCLLLTASEDRGSELRALDAGADAFVRKDESFDVFLAKLGATLRSVAGRASGATASLLGPKKILAVDDSLTYLHELADMLRDEGYDVVLARSGEEALELLAVEPVDCILLDLLMPGLGGQETCRRIKSAPIVRDIPLLMLTALEDRAAMLEGLGAGADDYISKASDFDVLKARVRAQIRRKQFEDENRRIRQELMGRELEAANARAAQELAETRATLVEELERKNAELEAFSYSVSHDLRAPLRAIDGFSQMLIEDHGGKLDVQALEWLQVVRGSARRMGELIDDLLQLSRVGKAPLRRQKIDLSELARSVAAELHKRDPERNVDMRIQDGLPADADSGLLRIALENLLGNAWKFTSKAPGALIEIGVDDTPEGRVYFIRDNGAGFNMAYAERLFRPFQRLHTEAEFPGTGIGLATIRRIIDRHGGRIWADSVVGEGASFYFTLNKSPGGRK